MHQRTQRLQVRVSAEVELFLKQRCAAEDLSIADLGGLYLEQMITAVAKGAQEGVMLPHIRNTVKRELAFFRESLMDLLLRTYLEASTARRITEAAMVYPAPQDRRLVKEIEAENWQASVNDLKRDIRGMEHWHEQFRIFEADAEREASSTVGS